MDFPKYLVRFAAKHPRSVLAASALLVVAGAILATRVRVASDILALLPEDNQVVEEFKTTVLRFGSTEMLLVALEIEDRDDEEAYLEYADLVASSLEESPLIKWVQYRIHDSVVAAEPLLGKATLFLEPEALDEFLDDFNDEGFRRRASELAERLRKPTGALGLKAFYTMDPMGLIPLVAQGFELGEFGQRFDKSTGYLIDPERRFVLLLAKPTRPAADIPFCRELKIALDQTEAACAGLWHEDGWEGEPPGIIYGGGYSIALSDSDLIVQDMVLGAVIALVGVIFLFMWAFRRPIALLVSFVPLVSGLILVFAFAVLVLGRLNVATSAFAALLIGLGIDFIIILYGRYIEERDKGKSHLDALEILGASTSRGVLLGAVTTSSAFFAFMISGFRGLSELGLLTGAGILILALVVFIQLPAILTLLDRRAPEKSHRLTVFGLQHACRFSLKYSRPVLLITVLTTLVLGAAAWRVEYDEDILNMRSTSNRGVKNQNRIMDAFGIRFTPIMVRVDGASEAEVVEKAKQLAAELTPLVDGENLAKIDSLIPWIPAYERQRAIIKRLQSIDEDPETLRTRMADAFEAEGLNPAGFKAGFDRLFEALAVDETLNLGDYRGTDLDRLLSRYLSFEEGNVSTLLYCYPPAGKWRSSIPPGLWEAVRRVPNTVVSGPVLISLELKRVVWRDASMAALLGVFLVLSLLRLMLGQMKRVFLALIPLSVGMIWMVGLMAIFGRPINFMNVFVFTMIIGIGVDYGIHFVHRWFDGDGDPEGVVGTARAIGMAAMTTMVGFGSLIFSHFPGLRSMGVVALLGASCTALVSITLLPTLLSSLHGRVRTRNVDGDRIGERGELSKNVSM